MRNQWQRDFESMENGNENVNRGFSSTKMGGKRKKALILMLVLAIILFSSITVFARTCSGWSKCSWTASDKLVDSCGECSGTISDCYHCYIKTGGFAHCTTPTTRTTWYGFYSKCEIVIEPGPCVTRTAASFSRCAASAPIPEFFGIEFGEMELSTGIIALIAAIGLPMVLFRKKR